MRSGTPGTQSSLTDVLAAEADRGAMPADAAEVLNCVRAMNLGIAELNRLPLSLRLIRMIHRELMTGVRGGTADPGEFRRTQNWIGPQGATLTTAAFVPPPPHEMMAALGDLEHFLHERDALPALVHCAVVHAQFETIHPFLDGNGRVGRLLITFQLVERGILQQPLLYLSRWFKRHRVEYYDRLTAVRTSGDWEGWVAFFLRGVVDVGREATALARSILQLREAHLVTLGGQRMPLALPMLEMLFQTPMVTVRGVEAALECTYGQANGLVGRFAALGILREVTGNRRNRVFAHAPYLHLFDDVS